MQPIARFTKWFRMQMIMRDFNDNPRLTDLIIDDEPHGFVDQLLDVIYSRFYKR